MNESTIHRSKQSPPKAHEYGRPETIEDASNRYIVHPLSDQAVKIALRLGFSPNFVSILGLLCGILAGYCYYHLPQTSMVYGGFLAMVAWHVLDGADGRLARATGRTSAFGRIIDGICDHVVFAAVYIALTLHVIETGYALSVWWLVVGAGLSHAVQAAGYEERRQKYQRRLKGVARSSAQASLVVVGGKKSFLAGLYDKAQMLVAGRESEFDIRLEQLRKIGSDRPAIALVGKTAPMVRAWGILNANNRTLLIFLFSLVGQPAFYFAVELFAFNVILAILMFTEAQLEKKLSGEARALIDACG
ncbi:CDP-alcohol phosphatidyltransferase family protein [Kordiimonas aestuarii]|uniref:CDP-alcohol phosphatidyltransferase family protein n=1 Tax=Kordiimonas aestuarii TaxID=1005925 RepID=UPI0021CF2820|nr:CDP-alcohol phosphatidyltransferase family protein [Kordiimonas aestuarii]